MIKTIKALLIEDDPDYALLLKKFLADKSIAKFELQHADCLSRAEPLVCEDKIDIVLLDLNLPDSQGLATFEQVLRQSPEVPIIILTGNDDHEIAIKAVQDGAQDFLVKGQFDRNLLVRAIHYAIERHRLLKELETARRRDEFRANHDDLTQLPNRQLFHDRLHHAIAQAKRYKYQVAVLFLDLNKFKLINDNLGHDIGDKLLQKVAARLTNRVRESDTVARLGGDEFTVILTRISQSADAITVGRKLADALSEGFEVEGHPISVTTSLGVSIYPADGKDVEALVKNADVKMYRAKNKQKQKGGKPKS